MKIVLEHGKQFYVQTCNNCNCKFLYQEFDISLIENANKELSKYSFKIQCPECKEFLNPTRIKYISDIKHYGED